jgi:hypothetical protein
MALCVAAMLTSPAPRILAQQDPSIELIHTNDWQPGNQVSFTIRGKVVDGKPAGQAEATFTGRVVELRDSRGRRLQIPWSPLLRFTVPPAAAFVTATLLEPGGERGPSFQIPVHEPAPPAGRAQARLLAPPVSQAGRPFRVHSPAGGLNGSGLETKLIVRPHSGPPRPAIAPVAESPHSALFEPKLDGPGSYRFTVKEEGVFEETFPVAILDVELDTSRIYRVGQQGTLAVVLRGLPEGKEALRELISHEPSVDVVNATPRILAFLKEPARLQWKVREQEAAAGRARREIAVQALVKGEFQITALLATPRLIPPSGPGDRDQPPPPVPGAASGPPAPDPAASQVRTCGPDVTEGLVASLNRTRRRLKELSDDERGFLDGAVFLWRNGGAMDFIAADQPGVCPVNCPGTVTLCNRCVYSKATNNILYGLVCYFLGVSEREMGLVGHGYELGHRFGLDPIEARAAYVLGHALGRKDADLTAATLCDELFTLRFETSAPWSLTAEPVLPRLAWTGYKNCKVCPQPCTVKWDFSTLDWELSGGRIGSFQCSYAEREGTPTLLGEETATETRRLVERCANCGKLLVRSVVTAVRIRKYEQMGGACSLPRDHGGAHAVVRRRFEWTERTVLNVKDEGLPWHVCPKP